MKLMRTDKDEFTGEEILKEIKNYQETIGVELNKRFRYYKVDNPPIIDRKPKEVNNPDTRMPSGYGRKISKTFRGYGFAPRYTTYKAEGYEKYMEQLQETFDLFNEHLVTSRIGKYLAIYGISRELGFIAGVSTEDKALPVKAEPKFVSVDPRFMITYYDYSYDPRIKIAIKWDVISKLKHTVDVFYPDKVVRYVKMRDDEYTDDWKIDYQGEYKNYFQDVPVIDYWMDEDEADGLISPIHKYIDGLDALQSGSIDEFMRFAESYLRIVGGSLDDPRKKTFNDTMKALQRLKKTRIFSGLKSKDDITFLTKEIPSEYIKFLTDLIIDQIHTQSHVPDFAKFKDLSGIAVQRLMFDFENIVSDALANVDAGLIRRIDLINSIYKTVKREVIPTSKITINHKRNVPLNMMEFADVSVKMKQAGLSRWLIADIWPDDIIPDPEKELKRQDEDRETLMPNLYGEDVEIRETSVSENTEE
jgi:SPP1 family phage portal protein